MFRSKKDVDSHVRDVFSKCKLENERLKLCFGIAKQYCSIREFDSARRYLETYLNSNPTNLGEAHKLMGDILQELGDNEKALESYKASYSAGKTRDSLNRVCDLLTRGFGSKESAESKRKWFDMQKSTVNNNPLSATSSAGSSPVVPRRTPVSVGGPPKGGFNHSLFTNGSPSPLVSSTSKTNGTNVDLQLRYLERRLDDGLGKILEQNTLVLEQMLKIKEDMKDLGDKVEHVAVNQEQMQLEIKELKEKQQETQVLAIQSKQSQQAMQQMVSASSCKKCEDRPVIKEVHQPCKSTVELTALKEQMERMELRTTKAIENLQASFRFPDNVPPFNLGLANLNTGIVPSATIQPLSFPTTLPTMLTHMSDPMPSNPQKIATPPAVVASPQSMASSTVIVSPKPPIMTQTPVSAMPIAAIAHTPPAMLEQWSPQTTLTPIQNTGTNVSLSVIDYTTPKKSEENAEPSFPGLNLSGKFSFADLAKNNNSSSSFSFGSTTGNQTFSGVGAPLFSSLTPTNKPAEGANTSGHAEEGDDDFVPTAEFQPVIPLPPLVEVKKGDEDENTIAEYRAKLYRFISETKEWKERGVGNVKLLQSKTDSKKCRVVMWREKVGKLACNFNLYPDIKVTNYQSNAKVLCWKCQDFAEEPAWETFTLRFGNEDNCAHFKTEMERLAKLTVAADESSPPSTNNEPKPSAKVDDKQAPLSQMFKKPEGSWNCEGCYCTNNKDATACIACQTVRPGYEQVEKPNATTENETTQPKFSFGFPTANTSAPTFNFGFANTVNSNPSPTTASVVDGVTPTNSEEPKEPAFPGLNLSGKFSFADLAKNNNAPSSFSFGSTTGNQTFSGVGAPLFSSLTPTNKPSEGANTSGHAEEGEDDFVPTAEFQPVIPLPPLVEVKKGDEDENTIAEYRAKLYRFISETKEWKERGVGNVKLLQSKTDSKKCRVVMWREKVGKLACNFNLYPEIKVTNYQSNPKVLCWQCHDFAEEPAWETFTLRFGNEDNCANFKTEMERLAKLTVAADDSSPSSTNNEPKPSAPAKADDKQTPLSQMFKKPEGSWNCEGCYCTNNKDATACVACQTVRPGYEQVEKPNAATENENTQPKFSFGFPAANTSAPTFNFGFANTVNSNTTPTPAADAITPTNSDEPKEPAFPGLNLSGKFSFADLAKNNNAPSSFSFGSTTGNQTFSGVGAPLFSSLTPVNKTVEGANTSAQAEEGEDDFVPTAEFQPVIPLPPVVEVKKGDEDENTIAEYRAKLYRFISETKEWKERGVGNVKLLQSKTDSKKCRVVMWREKVGKLACNFNLYPDIKVTNYQSNPKVLCWKCQDFAEEPAWETFTLRFGNEDNCAHFKTEMERLAKLTVAADENSPAPSSINNETSTPPKADDKQAPLSQMFKKPEGSWNCEGCYCTNNKDVTVCVACQTVRPGCEQVEKPSTATQNEMPKFSFGFPAANTSAPTTITSIQTPAPKQTEDDSGSCAGCVGCDPDTYKMPEERKRSSEEIIGLPLDFDASNLSPSVVHLNMFTSPSGVGSISSNVNTGHESSGSVDNKNDSNVNNSFSNFSFSFHTPEKTSPNPFQFKTPTFSFKSDGNSSIFGGGGSIFTPPTGGNPPGSTPSPFVSPFAQQNSLLNNSASPQTVPFAFTQPQFNQQSPVQSPDNNEPPVQREEDEYEDVDDEEEDECMFEDDVHVFIQDDATSGTDFSDKGEAVVRVLYDGESYCARLVIMIDGETIAEHLVAVETTLESKEELTYEWTGICNYESPVKSRIKAVFSDEDAFTSFKTVMTDSLEFAEQAGVTEAFLLDDTSGGY